jgi:uncharacterized protein (DUF433 family)
VSTHDLLRSTTTDPGILGGKPIICGMRVSVEHVLKAPAAGVPEDELLADIPILEPEGIRACLAYAAEVLERQTHFVLTR